MPWRNATHAFVGNLRNILTAGEAVHVRGRDTREIRNCVTVVEHPEERCIMVSGRRGSIFAAIAETVWVLAGRNDLDFLTVYVPSARNYSDDGRTWRAGYGPRIRNWRDIDQLMSVADLLHKDRTTRRAVMSIFDPAQDFVESKDIPCNNWVHAYIRHDALALNVAIRSNDIWYGFSGINAFEWSVVQEILAFWSGASIGPLTFFASSLHLYTGAHGDRPVRVARTFPGVTCYEAGIGGSRFATPRDRFDTALQDFLAAEAALRSNPATADHVPRSFEDPLLRDFFGALWIYHGHTRWSREELCHAMRQLPDNDITLAIYDYLAERGSDITPDPQAHPSVSAFWPIVRGKQSVDIRTGILEAICALHREKSGVYGDSWKRRGEILGVLANIDRKVDRLEGLTRGGHIETVDETSLDTAVDLLVYALKYVTYLADQSSDVATAVGFSVVGPWSDGVAGFEELLRRVRTAAFDAPPSVTTAASAVVEASQALAAGLISDAPPPLERLDRVQKLADAALVLVASIAAATPSSAQAFVAQGARR